MAAIKKRTKSVAADDPRTATRALVMLRELLTAWWRVTELAHLIGRDAKTARRHLAAIRAAGFKLAVRTEREYGRKQYRVVL